MDERVFITGGSTGIGKAIASKFLEKGCRVTIVYGHDDELCKKTLSELESLYNCKGNVIMVKCDVSKSEDVKKAFKISKEAFGPVSILVNNAGIAQDKLFTDITDEDWNIMIGVNLTGCFNCAREAIPDMVHEKSGAIINISSMWGICGAAMEVHYSAAKAGVIGLTKALAKELGPSGITVNCVAPGAIETRMNDCYTKEELDALCEETPLGRMGSPYEIADAVMFLAGNNFTTGQVISPNGGLVI